MKNKSKKVLIPKVTSIADLITKATTDPLYKELAMVSASNLGGSPKDLKAARQWLETNASEGEGGSEKGVVQEINFCRDLVGREPQKAPGPTPPAKQAPKAPVTPKAKTQKVPQRPPTHDADGKHISTTGRSAFIRAQYALGKTPQQIIEAVWAKGWHCNMLSVTHIIESVDRAAKETKATPKAEPKRAKEQIAAGKAKLGKTPAQKG